MIRNLFKTGVSLNTLLPLNLFNYDKVENVTETEKKADLSELQNETGWDRIKEIFEVDDLGNISKELETILNVGGMSIFIGALYGGMNQSRDAYINFIKNNQATVFNDHIEAKKKLHDAMVKSFGRGAWKWSWRLAVFCTTFMGVSTTISVYRGKTSVVEYVAAGFVSGSLYKFNMGPRASLVGGVLGATLGLIGGGATFALLKATGVSMDEVRYWQHKWKKQRVDYLDKGITEYMAKEEGELSRHRNKKLGEAGKTLENIDG